MMRRVILSNLREHDGMNATWLLARVFTGLLLTTFLLDSAWGQSGARTAGRYGSPAASASAEVPVQITRKPNFGIPFELSPDAYNAREVRLYGSDDLGRNWRLADRRAIDARGFQFQAPSEGEYWFAVRTADANGQLTSQLPLQPELKVLVDTQLPRLDMRVNIDAEGLARATWLAQDPHLAGHTFRLQFQDRSGRWQPVRVRVPNESDQREQWEGAADWRVDPSSTEVIVVAEIEDEAKNLTRVHKRAALSQVARGSRPRFDNAIPVSSRANENPVRPSRSTAEIPRQSVLARSPNPRSLGRSNEYGTLQNRYGNEPQREQPRGENPFATQEQRARKSAVGSNWNEMTKGIRDFFGGVKHTAENYGHAQPWRDDETTEKSPYFGPVAQQRTEPGFGGLNPPSKLNAPLRPTSTQEATTRSRPTARRRPHITSSPNFEIDYDVQGVGTKGARLVELWFSRDDGSTWELYGSDADRQSPMEVRLTREGLYGFRLAVHGYDSPPPRAPQNNEPADVWVAADWTKPVGRITRATIRDIQSQNPTGNQTLGYGFGQTSATARSQPSQEMLIEWVAEDALLEEQPITISYSDAPDGRWIPIAAAIHNKGSYRWVIDRQLPERVYLQMEIRDVAGNVTSTVYEPSVSSTSQTPAGRIREIRPIRRSALRPMDMR